MKIQLDKLLEILQEAKELNKNYSVNVNFISQKGESLELDNIVLSRRTVTFIMEGE